MTRFLIFLVALSLQESLGVRLKRQAARQAAHGKNKNPSSGCPLAGLKVQGNNRDVRVMYPVPNVGFPPFRDYRQGTFSFLHLGDFGSLPDAHFLYTQVSQTGSMKIKAAVPLNIYMNFLFVDNPGQPLPQFSSSRWRVSSKRGVTVDYTGTLEHAANGRTSQQNREIYTPERGVVISRPLAAGRELELIAPSAFKGNASSIGLYIVFVQPNCGDSLASCPLGGWQVTRQLGQGQQGAIHEVVQIDAQGNDISGGRTYALKLPLDDASASDINFEREIALAASSCENVLDVIDAQPCIIPEGSRRLRLVPSGYVMPKLKADLQNWLESATETQKQTCFNSINEQFSSGLECLHEVGRYVHGDIKADNAMYEYETSVRMGGCPAGVQIIDFGLASRIGSQKQPNPSHLFVQFSQYPTGLYYEVRSDYPLRPTPNGQTDTLGIFLSPSAYRVDPNIDWCMYRFMIRIYFGHDVRWNDGLDCGMMGPNRGWWMKAEGTQMVSGSWPPPVQQAQVQAPPRARGHGLRGSMMPQAPQVQNNLNLQVAAAPVARVERVVFVNNNNQALGGGGFRQPNIIPAAPVMMQAPTRVFVQQFN